jgi:hypothetical protein
MKFQRSSKVAANATSSIIDEGSKSLLNNEVISRSSKNREEGFENYWNP